MSESRKSGLLLLGIGGGACRLVRKTREAFGEAMRTLCVDTDSATDLPAAEGAAPLPFLLLGGSRLAGHGAGGDFNEGRQAARDDWENILNRTQDTRTVMVVSFLGGGTGSGATSEIVKKLHENGLTTFCLLVKPFSFEGSPRIETAERAVSLIEESADSLLVIDQDTLFADGTEATLAEAQAAASEQLLAAITLFWRILFSPGFIRLDAERLHSLVIRGGKACLGVASATGPDRAEAVVQRLTSCKLFRNGEKLKTCNAVLVGILAGEDLRLAEIGRVMEALNGLRKPDCRLEMGTVQDAAFDGKIELVVMGFAYVTDVKVPPVFDGGQIPILTKGGGKSSRSPKGGVLKFGPVGKGRFQKTEATVFNGCDYDVPTYIRRGITLER